MGSEVGFARADLTVYEPTMAMLGWGLPDQRPERVGAPLRARAMVLRRDGRARAFVVADLCFVSAALRARVRERLAATESGAAAPIGAADLMLTATHTHSGPNGFSHAFFYDLSAPGLSERVLDGLARGIVDAIRRAEERAAPAVLRLGQAELPTGIAFNRSVVAHRCNPEERGRPTPAAAVSRTMSVLRADDAAGRPRGAVAFFALHATSVHGDQRVLHPDHKGLAAARFEAAHDESFVALFAQGAAGDVSPNHRFDQARGVTVGAFDDDLASAAHVADAQVAAARVAFERAAPLEGPWLGSLARVDLETRPVSRRFAPQGTRTTPGRLGLAMALGTAEGPGPLAPLARLVGLARRIGRDPKRVLLTVGPVRRPADRSRLGGVLDPTRIPLPHPAFERARAVDRAGGLGDLPWIPTVLPVQLWQLGPLAIAALPNEPTTVAGQRIARAVREALPAVERVLVVGYANAYSGYLTTPEEYALQRYEGAYTLFGPHTLGAFQETLDGMARRLDASDGRDEGPPLPMCSEAEAAARAHSAPSSTTMSPIS